MGAIATLWQSSTAGIRENLALIGDFSLAGRRVAQELVAMPGSGGPTSF
jgi:hypothetical protein